jgi:hypothetical protein
MKTSIAVSIGLLLFSICAFPQDAPIVDVFLGYSFMRVNSAQTIPAFTANGGMATVGFNLNSHIGLEGEFGFHHNGNVNNYEFDTTTTSFLFGPRLSYGRSKRFDPYAHTLFGGTYGTTSIAQDSILVVNPGPTPSGGRYKASQANFAMAIGGGLDVKLNNVVIFRPIQLDYLLTRFQTPSVVNGQAGSANRNQHNLRYAVGFAFNFGAR